MYISQSHLNELYCTKYFYINRAFKIAPKHGFKTKGYIGKVNALLCELGHNVDNEEVVKELKQYIPEPEDIKILIAAIQDKNKLISEFIR